jgi:predicted secreted Zn-dependent protease
VAGRSQADLLAAMQRWGPVWEGRRFFGLTNTELRYAYRHVSGGGRCHPDRVVVTLNVAVTLPRWGIPRGTPYALERDWRHFERALRGHEDGHRRLAEEEAAALRRVLIALRAPACDGLDAEAGQAARALRARYADAHREYDRRTDHGRAQGAAWPRD